MSRKAIGNLIKQGLRKAYRSKTAPLQTASKIASRVSPRSKIAAGLAAIASPAVLNPGSGKKAAPKATEQKAPPKSPKRTIKGQSRLKGGTYTQGKRTGSKAGGGKVVSPFGLGMPGDDMSLDSPVRTNRLKKMKAGGLAIKGHGKAFLKSKR
jgi:hypothetical protein